jgi:ABC-type multidrug transport system fused ATPase/permease subunit
MIPIAIFSRKVRRSSREMQTQSAELTQIMTESFTGHRIVKAYNLENIAAEKFRETTRKSVGHYMRIIRAMEIPGPLIEFFGALRRGARAARRISFTIRPRGQARLIFCNWSSPSWRCISR